MPRKGLPASIIEAWKYETEALRQRREQGRNRCDYENDANAGLSGVQNRGTFVGIPYDKSSETINKLFIPEYEDGSREVVKWLPLNAKATMDDAGGINSTDQTIVVLKPSIGAFSVGDQIRCEDEHMRITSITADMPDASHDTWTVKRGLHGTDNVAHANGKVLQKWTTSVEMGTINLTAVLTGLPAPSNLVAKGLQDAIELTWDSNLSEDQFKQLKSFVLYFDDATFASWDPATESPPAGVTRIELSTDSRHIFVPRDVNGDIEYTARYFRLTAMNLSGVESAVSDIANATATVGGGDSRKPTAPTISVLLPGGNSKGQFLIEFGILPTDDVGRTGWGKTEVAIAPKDDTWDSTNGFSNPVETKTLNPPPCSGTFYLDDESQYDVSARIYNEAGAVWSDWCAVSSVATSEGVPDTNNPDPATLVVSDPGDAIGHNVLVTGTIGQHGITGGYWEVMATDSLANWPDTIAGVTGLRNIRSTGASAINVPIGGSVLTDPAADFITDGVAVGDVLYTYKAINTSTGEIDHAQSWVITARTATTITIDGRFQRAANDLKTALFSPVYYVVAQNWSFQGASPDTHPYLFEPKQAPFSAYFTVTGAKYWRIRFGNKHGLGEFIYWDGSSGSTSKASAITFTPSLIQTGAVANLAITEDKIAALAVTEGKLGSSAVTENKIAAGAVVAAKMREGSQGWTSNIVFDAVDDNHISWSAGTIKLADGTLISINANASFYLSVAGLYYIYYYGSADLNGSTNYSFSTGDDRILLAIAQRTSYPQKAFLVPVVGSLIVNSGQISPSAISTSKLQAEAVEADKILANTITSAQMTTAALTGLLIQTTDGGLIRTGSTYPRIELSNSGFVTYDSGGNQRIEIPTTWDRINFYDANGVLRGSLEGDAGSPGSLQIKVGSHTFRIGTNSGYGFVFDPSNNELYTGVDFLDQDLILYTRFGTFQIWDNNKINKVIEVEGTAKLGLFGATPVQKQTISGSKGGNAALGDLLTKLASMGLIMDSTT